MLDVRLPDGSGIDRAVTCGQHELRCLILTSFTERSMPDAILAGASGYVS